MFLAVTKAEINTLRLDRVRRFVFWPTGKPHGRRSGGYAIQRIVLRCCPQSKPPCQRVAAHTNFAVILYRILPTDARHSLRQPCKHIPCPAAKALLTPYGRCRPRRQIVVPILNLDSGQQKWLCGLPMYGFNFSFHPCKVMFIHHLQQQVFGAGSAVDAAGSVLYLQ